MIAENGIIIKNIFHMLSYAFKELNHKSFKKLSKEPFEHIEDLMAAILLIGTGQLVKQGLHRDYLLLQEDIQTIKGRINIPRTVGLIANGRSYVNCEFEEFTSNNLFNRILKATCCSLLHKNEVRKDNRRAIQKMLFFFTGVSYVDLHKIYWEKISFGSQNRLCELLLSICKFTYYHCLFNEKEGINGTSLLTDTQNLSSLYQHFLLEYFRRHHKRLCPHSPKISWDITNKENLSKFLPTMQTDVVLRGDNAHLIIDAKFYGHIFQTNRGTQSFHSHNLYQIFTYVQNYQVSHPDKNVAGMLLYAKTQEESVPNDTIELHGNKYFVMTLDLNTEFSVIRSQLDRIANYAG